MTCNEARRMITPYVKKELSEKETEEFLHHIENCSDCMDELDTYYTVYQALDLLDSTDRHDFNFRNMLKEDIRMAQRKIALRKTLTAAAAVLLILTELLMGYSVYTGYRIKQGEEQLTVIQRAMLRSGTTPWYAEDGLQNEAEPGALETELTEETETASEVQTEEESENETTSEVQTKDESGTERQM